jgi:hypothetical protein
MYVLNPASLEKCMPALIMALDEWWRVDNQSIRGTSVEGYRKLGGFFPPPLLYNI